MPATSTRRNALASTARRKRPFLSDPQRPPFRSRGEDFVLAGGCRERGGSFRYGSQKGLTWLSGFEGGPTLRHATTGAKMPATDIESEGCPLGGRRSWMRHPTWCGVEGCSLPPSRSLPKELEGTRYTNSWSDNSEPTLAAAATQSFASSGRRGSRGQDQGWASPDDERGAQAALLMGWSVVFSSPPDKAANDHVRAWGD